MGVSTGCARTLVDEFARAGLTDAVLAPGSRSAPLAMALADDERIRLHVVLDERSAAFFALGAAKASGRPVLLLSTSGTAAAHFHPAVLEAGHSRLPLLVCTADRPAELRATGAPQTTDQLHLYGPAVRFFADIPADGDPAARAAWRPIAARVWAEASGPPAGPVHVNVAFREPLVPLGADGAGPTAGIEPGRADGRPWVVSHRGTAAAPAAGEGDELGERILSAERGLVVAGWGSPPDAGRIAAQLGWPLLADAISGQRACDSAVTTYDALLRVPEFAGTHRPDLVIRFGGPLTSKVAMAWLDASVPQILVDPDRAWLDPHRAAAERVLAVPDLSPVDRPALKDWCEAWREADAVARSALDTFLDADDDPFEGRVARDVAAACAASPSAPALVVASSMPVRDLEAFAGRVPADVYANRGVNGIDGLVSTTLGVAAGRSAAALGMGAEFGDAGPAGVRRSASGGAGPADALRSGPAGVDPGSGPRRVAPAAVGLLGDLAFLHDAGGLLGAAGRGLDVVFVVVDNGGGGIFSFLPQAGLPSDRFELLFGTPPGADVAAVASAYGVTVERVARAGDVGPALSGALEAGGVRAIVVPTGDRTANVARHRRAWAAVADALAGAGAGA